MKNNKIYKGLVVRPSKNKRSKTRFWQLKGYKGEVVNRANSFYWEVNWAGLFDNGEWKPVSFRSLMRPVDLEPYS